MTKSRARCSGADPSGRPASRFASTHRPTLKQRHRSLCVQQLRLHPLGKLDRPLPLQRLGQLHSQRCVRRPLPHGLHRSECRHRSPYHVVAEDARNPARRLIMVLREPPQHGEPRADGLRGCALEYSVQIRPRACALLAQRPPYHGSHRADPAPVPPKTIGERPGYRSRKSTPHILAPPVSASASVSVLRATLERERCHRQPHLIQRFPLARVPAIAKLLPPEPLLMVERILHQGVHLDLAPFRSGERPPRGRRGRAHISDPSGPARLHSYGFAIERLHGLTKDRLPVRCHRR